MSDSQQFESVPRLFTWEQANGMLPLVRAIVQDLSNLSREVIERRERLALLKNGRQNEQNDLYRDELIQIEEELSRDAARLREYVEELQALGVDPKNGPEGIVDFKSLLNGRVVNLCWKLGEPAITHWHDMESGFAGRQPLPTEVTSGVLSSKSEVVSNPSIEDQSN